MATTIAKFLQSVSQTGLLTREELTALEASSQTPDADADALARDLVRRGKLTKFQATAIYQGRGAGLLLGNYLLVDRVGAGGMGQVFRARHRKMDRIVALKMLPKKAVVDPATIERFQREMKAAAKLTHPNIVVAHDADEADGIHFLVMEYVDGCDLSSMVKKQGPLPVSQALDVIRQAALGLQHAHAQSITHRDIKPSNLLIDKQGHVKILDMGLARFGSDMPMSEPGSSSKADLTTAGSVMGTVDYMAPEQGLDSRQADARSDIYSLGCTLHYLLAGRPPYGGDTIMKRLQAHQQASIPLLSQSAPAAPASLDAVFQKMLAKRPASRYQRVAEVLTALDGVIAEGKSRPAGAVAATAVRRAVPIGTPISDSDIKQARSVTLPGQSTSTGKNRSASSEKEAAPATSKRTVLIASLAGLFVLIAATSAIGFWWKQQSDQVAAASRTKSGSDLPTSPSPVAVVDAPAQEPIMTTPSSVTESVATSAPVSSGETKHVSNVATSSPNAIQTSATATPVTTTEPVTEPVTETPAAPLESPVSVAMPNEQPMAGSEEDAAEPALVPPPDATTLAAAASLVSDVFKDDLASAKTPETRVAVANRMMLQASAADDDLPGKYAMFARARELAIDAGDPALAERASESLGETFAIDPTEELIAALEKMTAKTFPAATYKPIAELAAARAQEAADNRQWDTAKRLDDLAVAAARKNKDAALVKQMVDHGKRLADVRKQRSMVEAARAALETNTDDAAANLIVGRYLCFDANDWSAGLEHLAKSSDGTLKELAALSADVGDDSTKQTANGDAWWDAADKAKGKDKENLRTGAAYWYSSAVEQLSGLAKTRVEKRLAELEAAATSSFGGLPAGQSSGVARKSAAGKSFGPANGLIVVQEVDCAPRMQKFALGPAFDSRRSWTLRLDILPTNLDKGVHQVFHYGDARVARSPIALVIGHETLECRLRDVSQPREGQNPVTVTSRLAAEVIGKWLSVVVRYDSRSRNLSMHVDGVMVDQTVSSQVPTPDKPLDIHLGGRATNIERFNGRVRSLWLGNQDVFTAPTTQSVKPTETAPPKALTSRPTGSKGGSQRGDANGLAIVEPIDCSHETQERTMGDGFNFLDSWTLAIEFQAIKPEDGKSFFFRKTSPQGGEPLAILLNTTKLEVVMNVSDLSERPLFSVVLPSMPMNSWVSMVLRYDAKKSEATLAINGAVVGRQSIVVSAASVNPQRALFGAALKTSPKHRYRGQVRNVWFGNDTPP